MRGGLLLVLVATAACVQKPEGDSGDPCADRVLYADQDGDGFGDEGAPASGCDLDGYVEIAGDCDDADASASPGGIEVCDGDDEDCDNQVDEDDAADAPTWYADLDADGYGDPATTARACAAPPRHVEGALDCDDRDGRIHPAAAERCDGRDDDCDGSVDEDAVDARSGYADLDGDGFGDAGAPVSVCAFEAGQTPDATDCDDADAATFPGADETCDGADEDCDGAVDEDAVDALAWYADADADSHGDAAVVTWACTEPAGSVASADDCDDADPAVLDGTPWYVDADADGHGDPAVWAYTCEAPAGHVAGAADCDDADGAVHPDAAEVCDDRDDDCDGAVDDDDTDLVGAPTWYTDADADGWGGAAVTACIAPAGTTPEDGDCDDADGAVSPGGDDVCGDGVDQDCDGVDTPCALTGTFGTADADVTLTGETGGDHAGETLAGGGDLDGDGFDDVLIRSRDRVYVAFGPLRSGSLADVPARSTPGYASDEYGESLTIGEDFDGDGAADWASGAPGDDRFGGNVGAVYLFSGAPAAATVPAADAAAQIFAGGAAGDNFGKAVALVPSLDGDPYGELLVGARYEDSGGTSAGAAYLFRGPTSGALDRSATTAEGILIGEAASDSFGYAVAHGGDLDGDGVGDLVVGAHGSDAGAADAGAVYVFTTVPVGTVDASAADVRLTGYAGAIVGYKLAGAGDVDGDGRDDLVLGVPHDDTNGTTSGAAYLVTNLRSGPLASSWAAQLLGAAEQDQLGYAVAGPGDVDLDGFADVLVGAHGDDTGGSSAGKAALYYGPLAGVIDLSAGDALFVGDAASDATGYPLATAGDTDGDGFPDLLVTAGGDDAAGSNAGAVHLWYGRGR